MKNMKKWATLILFLILLFSVQLTAFSQTSGAGSFPMLDYIEQFLARSAVLQSAVQSAEQAKKSLGVTVLRKKDVLPQAHLFVGQAFCSVQLLISSFHMPRSSLPREPLTSSLLASSPGSSDPPPPSSATFIEVDPSYP